VYVIYFLLTLPLRRNERARFFLDLLDRGLRDGRTAERATADAAASRDGVLGARFQLLAAYLERRNASERSLEHVPRLLPPQLRATLRIGERIGGLTKCCRPVADGCKTASRTCGPRIITSFCWHSLSARHNFIPLVLRAKVLPSYRAMFAGMLEGQLCRRLPVLFLAAAVSSRAFNWPSWRLSGWSL